MASAALTMRNGRERIETRTRSIMNETADRVKDAANDPFANLVLDEEEKELSWEDDLFPAL